MRKGRPHATDPRPIKERLVSRCEVAPGGCWLWRGAKTSRGYGVIRHSGQDVLVHRLSHELWKGAVPAGLYVCHTCDTPLCCNPEHLYAGTPKQNVADMHSRGRANTAHGRRLPQAKVDEAVVLEMRRLCHERRMSVATVARLYGLSHMAALQIVDGLTWKHVGGPTVGRRRNRTWRGIARRSRCTAEAALRREEESVGA